MSGILFAVILGAAAVASVLLAQRAPGRTRFAIHFSCGLLIALALAFLIAAFMPSFKGPALAIALLAASLAPPMLALAAFGVFGHRVSRRLGIAALAAAFLIGLIAATGNWAALALVPLLPACAALGVLALHAPHRIALQAMLSSLAFLLGLVAFIGGAQEALLLFFAGGILGSTLALTRASRLAVKEQRDLRRSISIAR